MRRPRFVYFDLDDTLLDHREAERRALADLHTHYAEPLAAHDPAAVHAVYREHNVPLWRDYGRGHITKDELKHLRFARTLAALGVRLDPDEVSAVYLDRYSAHWQWADGARDVFHAVADALPVGVLTNGFKEQQRAKLAHLPDLAPRCAPGTVLIAEEIGAWKPTPEAFAIATDAAGVAPQDILYVGDSYHSDVLGGTAAGWHVAWVGGTADRLPEGATLIDAWTDLTRLISL